MGCHGTARPLPWLETNVLSGRCDSTEHPTTRCLGRAGTGSSVGPCLLIKCDCREFVTAEGSAHRHNAGAMGAKAEFASQHAALDKAAGLELILHPNPAIPSLPSQKEGRARQRQKRGWQKGWEWVIWCRRKAVPCLLSRALRGETVNGLGAFHPSRTQPFPPLSSAPCLPPPATGKL